MTFDTIETSRLRLRAHRVADFESYLPLWQAEPFDSPMPVALTPEEVWARLLRFVGHWAHFGFGLFVVEDRAMGELIAEVGLAHFNRGVSPRLDGVPEAAWRVIHSRRREGIAAEAMAAALAWFDAGGRIQRSVCMVHPSNTLSMRLALRLGYREFDQSSYRQQTVILMERLSVAIRTVD